MANGDLWDQELEYMREQRNKPELTLRDGKFYRGDVEVPPEIGNREQIMLLQRIEREKSNQK